MKVSRAILLVVLAAGCAGLATTGAEQASVPAGRSHAIAEARGEFRVRPDGTREAIRYKGWTARDFAAFRTYAYDDLRPEIPITRATPPDGVRGDPVKGRALFLSRTKGPCTGCHLAPGSDVWPAGSVGPDLSTIGDRGLPDAYLYALVYDPRPIFPSTTMPPWGSAGVLTPEEIVHVIAYLQSLRGPRPPERDADRDPTTRPRSEGFGDNLDPTNNPAMVLAEGADALWSARGARDRACADCHAGGLPVAMRGVATRYPRYWPAWRRVMALEDFLAVHGPATTGRALPSEGADNLALTMLVKMASNGLPVAVDTDSTDARAALERGRASFYRRVGERNHACADCHTVDRGANKFLGGRLLANVSDGLTRHFPTWRTSQGEPWDLAGGSSGA